MFGELGAVAEISAFYCRFRQYLQQLCQRGVCSNCQRAAPEGVVLELLDGADIDENFQAVGATVDTWNGFV